MIQKTISSNTSVLSLRFTYRFYPQYDVDARVYATNWDAEKPYRVRIEFDEITPYSITPWKSNPPEPYIYESDVSSLDEALDLILKHMYLKQEDYPWRQMDYIEE